MGNLNQLFKQKLDKEFPPKQYPCQCKNACQRFNPEAMDCEGCSYCGSDAPDQHRTKEDIEYEARNGREKIDMAGVF